ncbi:MAG: hypothetical protein JSS73_14870 [Bacteroidetes bacterium]|nr:hypothetical protein [Bacteroidota bacterium]
MISRLALNTVCCVCLIVLSCKQTVVPNNVPQILQGYTCPKVMANYFVVIDSAGHNVLSSSSTSVKIILPNVSGVILDAPQNLLLFKIRLVSDTTKSPGYGGYAALGEFGPGNENFSMIVNGINVGTVSYNLTRLGDYNVGEGCFTMNSVTLRGKVVNYDKAVGILNPTYKANIVTYKFYSGLSAPLLVFQL